MPLFFVLLPTIAPTIRPSTNAASPNVQVLKLLSATAFASVSASFSSEKNSSYPSCLLSSRLNSFLSVLFRLRISILCFIAARISSTECCFRKTVDMEIKNAEIPKNILHPGVFKDLQFHPQIMTATEPIT